MLTSSLPFSQSAAGDNAILGKKSHRIKKEFSAKTTSGWSLPLMDANATVTYAKAIARYEQV